LLKTLVRPANLHGTAAAILGRGDIHTAATLDLSRYLLSQSTIVCSVAPEIIQARKPYNIVDASCSHLVNQNGDAWLNQSLLETYGTFRGAFNFVEHNQILSENKGRILDAVARKIILVKPDGSLEPEEDEENFMFAPSASDFLRSLQPQIPTPKPKTPQKVHTTKVQYYLDEQGHPKYVYYIDILVATSLQFKSLIEQILDGEFNAMSMGCVVTGSTCSFCGHEVREPYPTFCPCLLSYRGTMQYHELAKRHTAVAELCGIPGEPETNQFIEASWVKDPAFIGARRAFIIDLPESYKKTYSIPAAPEIKNNLAASMVKAASAGHGGMVIDINTWRNLAVTLSHNPMVRNQLERYLNQNGYSIEPMHGRKPLPIQTNDTREVEKVQKIFKGLGLK